MWSPYTLANLKVEAAGDACAHPGPAHAAHTTVAITSHVLAAERAMLAAAPSVALPDQTHVAGSKRIETDRWRARWIAKICRIRIIYTNISLSDRGLVGSPVRSTAVQSSGQRSIAPQCNRD